MTEETANEVVEVNDTAVGTNDGMVESLDEMGDSEFEAAMAAGEDQENSEENTDTSTENTNDELDQGEGVDEGSKNADEDNDKEDGEDGEDEEDATGDNGKDGDNKENSPVKEPVAKKEDLKQSDKKTSIEKLLEHPGKESKKKGTNAKDSAASDSQKEQPEQKLKYRANGENFEFTEKEVKEQFGEMFAKAQNYTEKMQALAPYKSMLATIKEQGLTQKDLNLMTDVLKKDKTAVAALLKKVGVDAFDLTNVDVEGEYKPGEYGKNNTELAIQEVLDGIHKDTEYKTTSNIVMKQWDDKSRAEFTNDPELIRQLHIDVKSGMYAQVKPLMLKLKTYDGGRKSDIEYYRRAGGQYITDIQKKEQKLAQDALKAEEATAKIKQVKADGAKRVASVSASKKRKAAATTKSGAGKLDGLDYLDKDAMSDDDFSDFMERHTT